MRPQQNRRMRGRGNNNRRGPNPLTRNYESNGPGVKIRGNAQHIADKYATLARDAQASGDHIMAENYFQHAEHYMRIILSAQPQVAQPLTPDDIVDDNHADDSDNINFLKRSSEELPTSCLQPVIEENSIEITFSTALDNEFPSEPEEKIKAERPYRPTRRRLPRRMEISSPTNTKQVESTNTDMAEQDNTITTDNSYSESQQVALPFRKGPVEDAAV
ncbi:MAG: hypothetical protein JSC189_000601 [Candidatus Tokpelaia sp. JSC189]|nr:MAG: hypothetical protein JSC189_000601 [Candidatus Tokpelaia sp. JSC189]